mgnify:CR=1 FL=1
MTYPEALGLVVVGAPLMMGFIMFGLVAIMLTKAIKNGDFK